MKTETALSETRPDLSRLSKKEKLKEVRHILRLDVGVVTWITKRIAEYKKYQKDLLNKVQEDPCRKPKKPKRIVDYSLDSTGFEKQFDMSESESSYFSEYSDYSDYEVRGIGDPTLLVENATNDELQDKMKQIAKIDFQKIDVLDRPYKPSLFPIVDSDDDKPKKEIPYNPYKDFFIKLPKQKQICRGGAPVILPRVISSAAKGVIYDHSMDRKGSIKPVRPCKKKGGSPISKTAVKMQSNYLPVYGEPLQKKGKSSRQDLTSVNKRSSSLLKADVPLRVVEGSDGEEELEEEEEESEEEEEPLFEEESYDLAMLGGGIEESDDPCVINPDFDDEYVLHPYDDPLKKSHYYETLQEALDEAGLFDDEPDLYNKYKIDTSEESTDCCQTVLPYIPFGDKQVSWLNKSVGVTFDCDGVLRPKLPDCDVKQAVEHIIEWTKPIPAWHYKYNDADDPYLHADIVCGYYPNYFDVFDWENVNVPDDLDTFEVKQQCFPQEPLHWENMAYFKENVRCPCCEKTLRNPRALQCLHIFCYKCIIMNFRVEEREGVKGYICPECEEWSDMNGYRLPATPFIERMEDRLYSVSHCKIACCLYKYLENFEHDFATIKCRECKNYYCEACFKEHKKDYHTSHHRYKWLGAVVFKEVNNYPISAPYCKKHHTETLDYYCHQCRYAFCLECKTEDHAHHVVVPLGKKLCMRLRELINPHSDVLRNKYDLTYAYLDYMEKKINIIKNWPSTIRQAHEDVDRKEQEYLYELEVLYAKEMYKQEEAWEAHLAKYKKSMDILARAINLMEVVFVLASDSEIIELRNHWDTVETIKALRHAHKPFPHYLNGHMRKFGSCCVNLHWIVIPSHKLVNDVLAVPDRAIDSLICSEGELIAMSWSDDIFDPCAYFIRVKRHWDQNRLEKRFEATEKLYRICYYKTRDLDKIVVVERKSTKHVHPIDFRPATYMEGEIIPAGYFLRAFDRDLNGEILFTDFFDLEVTPLAICQVPGKGLCYTGIGEMETTFICLVTNPFKNGPKNKKNIYISRDKYRPQRLDYICASRNKIAVTDTLNRDVSFLDLSGHLLMKINFGYSQPKGIFMDDSENLYVAVKNENRICKYDRNGRFVDSVVEFSDGLRLPLSVFIHQEHKYQIHVGCGDGFVRIYTIPEY